jgi:adenosylhomocysteine nucleosidase
VERSALHCARFSARVLSAIPRLLRVFSAVGARCLPQRYATRNDALSRVGIVAALATEARALTPTVRHRGTPFGLEDGTLLSVSGIGDRAATDAALALISRGADALVSFGMAGGLDPELGAGTIFLPAVVLAADGRPFETCRVWRGRVASALVELRPVDGGRLLSSHRAVTQIAAKQAVFRESGAGAVDMESAAVARVATARGVPFLAARVIVDTASDSLPACVMAASSSGELQVWRLLLALTRAPAEIVDVIRLALRFRVARAALRAMGQDRSLREGALT